MKLLYNKEFVAEIKEEIIEYNPEDNNSIYGICAIIE